MSTSPTSSYGPTSIRLPTLAPMHSSAAAYYRPIQLAPLVWRDERRGSMGNMTDGGESSCSESSVPIERLRLVSRSVSPVKTLPSMRVRKLHFPPPMSAKRRSHPTLEIAPRRMVLVNPSIPSTTMPNRYDSISPPMPSVTLLSRTAGFKSMRPITPMTLCTPRLAVPHTPRTKEAKGVGRMVLVNPTIAAHLKRGGVVNVRSRDGSRKWKISLPATATSPIVVRQEQGA